MSQPENSVKSHGKRAVGLRYGGAVPRTVDRWAKAGKIPKPDFYIGNRPFWKNETLERHERQSVAARAAAKVQPAKSASNEVEDQEEPQSAA
jgi:hypothetical protein